MWNHIVFIGVVIFTFFFLFLGCCWIQILVDGSSLGVGIVVVVVWFKDVLHLYTSRQKIKYSNLTI